MKKVRFFSKITLAASLFFSIAFATDSENSAQQGPFVYSLPSQQTTLPPQQFEQPQQQQEQYRYQYKYKYKYKYQYSPSLEQPSVEIFSTRHDNFSTRQRWGTWTLNQAFPGLGSIVVMDDLKGAFVQWLLTGAGLILIIETPGSSDLHTLGISTLVLSSVFNIFRSASYDRPNSYAYQQNDGLNIAVLPNRHESELMPYLFYSKTF
ncbi:MAG: hypothetical protein LBC85_10995 [Fibromonadaceae bacterium]|jgi:hypothetical protein|nr:hypothetical protein [Fibromonadaceae bacterium]